MNYKQKNEAHKEVKGLFKANYPKGCIKMSNETPEHFNVKSMVAFKYYKNGWEVYSEAVLKNGHRPDLVVVSGSVAMIVEILATETEEKFLHKLGKYPLPIRKVYVKDFKYEDFCI